MTCVCLAISACYEFVEWGTAVATGDAATAFLGTQGDVWDTQWDMFLCLLGALAAQITLSRVHDRQLAALPGLKRVLARRPRASWPSSSLGLAWAVWRTFPRESGSVEAEAGHAAAVTIEIDAHGVPTIRAQSIPDAMFGLGYVHAKDRLWQMEFQRRVGAGRLAEILGAGALFPRTGSFERSGSDGPRNPRGGAWPTRRSG